MAVDLASILLGLVAGAVPCLVWVMQLQRRHAARHGERALLEERLNAAQLAQAGLQAQLDASRRRRGTGDRGFMFSGRDRFPRHVAAPVKFLALTIGWASSHNIRTAYYRTAGIFVSWDSQNTS